MQRTKIIATLGPASSHSPMIEELILSGANVFRLNFSFGTHDEHRQTIERIREACRHLQRPVGILLDLQGPKIRVGRLALDLETKKGDIIYLSDKENDNGPHVIPTTYREISKDVQVGQTILMADGAITLKVLKVQQNLGRVECEVIQSGIIRTGKGINLPNTRISLPALTDKDKEDVLFGLENKVDYIALSFVRSAQDIRDLKEILQSRSSDIPIIAKIEKPEAVENILEILEYTDGVMIARGDLAVEISLEKVPMVQKRIIELANQRGKITITATQMLESMIENPVPTRAEVSDVANAILDGTDAVMLSGETAYGKHPLHAVAIMKSIAKHTESNLIFDEKHRVNKLLTAGSSHVRDALCASASYLSFQLEEKALAVFSATGTTALLLSKYRPRAIIYAVTGNLDILRRMSLYNNVYPILLSENQSHSVSLPDFDNVDFLEKYLIEKNLLQPGDRLILVMGENHRGTWSTKSIKVVDISTK